MAGFFLPKTFLGYKFHVGGFTGLITDQAENRWRQFYFEGLFTDHCLLLHASKYVLTSPTIPIDL